MFLATYESGQAEYIRFQIRLNGGSEQVTRFNVWKLQTIQQLHRFDQQRQTGKDGEAGGSPTKNAAGAREGAAAVQDGQSGAGNINFSRIPMPVFDAFQQVFIVTDGAESFYMDLDGEYDRNLQCNVQWSSIPTNVEIVRPFLVGLLQNHMIEVRHIMAPGIVTQVIQPDNLQLCLPYGVSTQTNLKLQILDSMYMILTAAAKQQRMQVLVKLEQFVPQVQLRKLVKARMFNTATNFATMLIEN